MSEKIEFDPNKNEIFLRSQIVEGLRSLGVEDPEVKEKLIEWTVKQEEKVESAGRTVKARVDFEIERARLYFDGGYMDEAWEALEAALLMAEQESRDDLIRKTHDEMLKMEW